MLPQFSEGTRRLLQRHPVLPAERTRALAAAFIAAQGAACRRLGELGYPLERVALELQAGHLPYFREGADRDRKRSCGQKASYRFAGFTPSHVEEWRERSREHAAGVLAGADFADWQAGFLLRFTFEVIEQVARRTAPLPAGRTAETALEEALVAARRIRDEILAGNFLLIAKLVIARARLHPLTSWDDLFAAGVDGLMIAIHRYDPGVGQFSTYATPWVTMAMDRFVAKTRSVIRIPVGLQEKVRRGRREAAAAGTAFVTTAIPEVQSLEEPLTGSSDQSLVLADVVADPLAAAPGAAAEHADLAAILQERMRQLDPLKQFVLALRNDIGDAAGIGARLFRAESALSLARGRAIAAAAAKSADRPARVRLIDAPPPVVTPLPAAPVELALAI